VVRERRRDDTWGPKKLREVLATKYGVAPLPAVSTIGNILKRRGLTRKTRGRRPVSQPDRLAASLSDTGVTVYVSRYDNMLAWRGDVRRQKVFILPITFPVSRELWVLRKRRGIAEFKRRFSAHLAASPSEFLQEPGVGDRMVAGLYGKYVYTLMFEQLATLVQYLKCGVQLCAFEAGKSAGFYYLISHLLKSRAEQYLEFNSALLKAVWYGHDVIFPMDGVYGNGFIAANFENYFVCTRTPELLQRCVDQSLRVSSSRSPGGGRRLYDLSDVKGQEF